LTSLAELRGRNLLPVSSVLPLSGGVGGAGVIDGRKVALLEGNGRLWSVAGNASVSL